MILLSVGWHNKLYLKHQPFFAWVVRSICKHICFNYSLRACASFYIIKFLSCLKVFENNWFFPWNDLHLINKMKTACSASRLLLMSLNVVFIKQFKNSLRHVLRSNKISIVYCFTSWNVFIMTINRKSRMSQTDQWCLRLFCKH